MLDTSKLAWLLLNLILALSVSGCRGKAQVATTSRTLAEQINNKTHAPNNTGPQINESIQEQNVYLDASKSMKGFVNPAEHSKFDDLLDSIGDAMPGCRLYKYGQKGNAAPQKNSELIERAQFGQELHKPDFYGLTYNPDDRLVDELVGANSSALSVLITDGVYSQPQGQNAPPVVEAIDRWMQNKKVFGILMFRSKFNGPFYSEKNRGFLPGEPVRVDDRPFYAFVFSPTEQGYRNLQDKLRRRFPEMQSILFSDTAVASAINLDERVKGTYSFVRPPQTRYYWQMFDETLFSDKNPSPVGFHVNFPTSPDYPVSEFKIGMTADYYRWVNGTFKKSDDGTPQGFAYEISSPGDKGAAPAGTPASGSRAATPAAPPNVIVKFPKDTGCDYSFYALTMTLSPVSLRQGIEDIWSARDDSDRKNANKSFRFFELVNALSDLHFKNHLAQKVFPTIFVTISNK